jgi:hypothetical protein
MAKMNLNQRALGKFEERGSDKACDKVHQVGLWLSD